MSVVRSKPFSLSFTKQESYLLVRGFENGQRLWRADSESMLSSIRLGHPIHDCAWMKVAEHIVA
jgi:hypothetical protein